MAEYNIKIVGDHGEAESKTISGTVVGPFGVAHEKTNGVYRVTHLHSGLKVRYFSSSGRDKAIAAAEEFGRRLPWWRSHQPSRIAEINGIKMSDMRAIAEEVAAKFGCEGEEDQQTGDDAGE